MTKIPHDDILEGLYKLRIRESGKLKTVLELYDLETHQKKLGPDYHRLPWTSLICVSSPKCVYMCVRPCPSQTPNAFICVSPNAFICVSPNAFICVSPNAFICVSPNAFICVSPNVSADATELASLAYLCSLRSHVF